MSKLPIAVSPTDESGNSLTVTFTKKDFSDFVFNLFVTPREERHNFLLGFDLFKDNLRKIVEKFEQHVQSNHEVLNRSLLIDVILSDGVELTYQSHEQFFNVDDPRSGKVESITLSFGHVIAFFREGKKSFERQQTSLRFSAGKVGQIQIAIRSTDISWPNGIFALLERELVDLAKQTVGPHAQILRSSTSPFFDTGIDLNSFDNATIDKASPRVIVLARRFITGTSFGFAILAIAFFFFASVKILVDRLRPPIALVVSEDSNILVEVSLDKLIQELGMKNAISELENGAILKAAGMPISKRPAASLVAEYFAHIPHLIYVFGVMVGIAVFIFFWSFYARRLAFEGRILIYSSKVQPRALPSILSSVVPALALGALASLLATGIWEGLK